MILRGAAKKVQVNDRNHQQNIFKLWGLLRVDILWNENWKISKKKAKQAFYPNGRLQKHDCQDTTPALHSICRYFAPCGRVSPRGLRYQQNEIVRNRRCGCYACGRSNHRVKNCKDRTKRDQWCMQNRAYYCTGPGHRSRDCVSRNRHQKSKEEGGSTDPAIRTRRLDANNNDPSGKRGYISRGRYPGRGRGGRRTHDEDSWRRNGNGRGWRNRFNNSRGCGVRANDSSGRGLRETSAQTQFTQQTDEALDQSDQQPKPVAYKRDFVNADEETDPKLERLYAKKFNT